MSITLFCLVKGNTTANAFSVKISSDEPISELKKAIRREKEPEFDNFPADKLKLWKVEISDDRDDLLSNLSLQDDELLATRNISKYFADSPAEECIHVIVEPPEATATSRREQELLEQVTSLQALLNKSDEETKCQIQYIYEQMKDKSETASFSTVTNDRFQHFLEYSKLSLKPVQFNGSYPNEDIDPYKWSSYAENHSTQRKKIIKYLDDNLKPNLPEDIVIKDVANKKTLLDMRKGLVLPFNIHGGTDVILVSKNCVAGRILKLGIHAIIELKKNVEEQHTYQAILEMIAADCLVNKEVKVFGLLSDLEYFLAKRE